MVLTSIATKLDKVLEYGAAAVPTVVAGAAGTVIGALKGAYNGSSKGAQVGQDVGGQAGKKINKIASFAATIAIGILAKQLASEAGTTFQNQALTFALAGIVANQLVDFTLLTDALNPIGAVAGGVIGALGGFLKGVLDGAAAGAQTGLYVGSAAYNLVTLPGRVVGTALDRVVDVGDILFAQQGILAPSSTLFTHSFRSLLAMYIAFSAKEYFMESQVEPLGVAFQITDASA